MTILAIGLIFSLFLTGCNKQVEEVEEETNNLEDVSENLSNLESLEDNLDSSDVEQFEEDLNNFDW